MIVQAVNLMNFLRGPFHAVTCPCDTLLSEAEERGSENSTPPGPLFNERGGNKMKEK
jgi:hypothetical protein